MSEPDETESDISTVSPTPCHNSPEPTDSEDETVSLVSNTVHQNLPDTPKEKPEVDIPNRKLKKRVSFVEDKYLVSVHEIPIRQSSPMSEELEPYNSEKLAEDMAKYRLGGLYHRYSGLNGHKPDVLNKKGDKASFGLMSRRLVPNKGVYEHQQLTGMRNKHWSNKSQFTSQHMVGNPQGFRTTKGQGHDKRTVSSYINGKIMATSRDKEARLSLIYSSSGITKSSYGYQPRNPVITNVNTPHVDRLTPQSTVRVHSSDTKRIVNYGGPQLQVSSEALSLLPRIRASPYRQSSASSVQSMRPVTSQGEPRDPSDLKGLHFSASASDWRPQSQTKPDMRNSANINTIARKYHAWHAANNIFKSPQVETPCISQMWEPDKGHKDTNIITIPT